MTEKELCGETQVWQNPSEHTSPQESSSAQSTFAAQSGGVCQCIIPERATGDTVTLDECGEKEPALLPTKMSHARTYERLFFERLMSRAPSNKIAFAMLCVFDQWTEENQ